LEEPTAEDWRSTSLKWIQCIDRENRGESWILSAKDNIQKTTDRMLRVHGKENFVFLVGLFDNKNLGAMAQVYLGK
jgi:predicted 2-oxoglutarate/Fe(II)-dependent dioxygenase YbiX